jgi:putative peptide zinc metalloprotease protein
MVNIAGVYFQCFFLIVLLVGFWMTGDDMLRYMILILNLGFLMTLNPFFKFDGYWIVSDLLGVPSLRKRSIEIIKYYWNRIMRRRIQQMPYLLRIGLAERWGLAIYAAIVNFFMGYYFIYIIPRFLYNFLLSFPGEMQELILYLSNNLTPPFALMRNIGMQLLFLALLGYLFTKMIRSLKKQNSKNGEQA